MKKGTKTEHISCLMDSIQQASYGFVAEHPNQGLRGLMLIRFESNNIIWKYILPHPVMRVVV